MSTDTNEQYRPGFEAWAIGEDGPYGSKHWLRKSGMDYTEDCVEAQWQGWAAAKREASTEQQKDEARDAAMSPELQAMHAFLLGEAPLGGVWFGDRHPESKEWWWRNNLRAAIAHTKAQSEK